MDDVLWEEVWNIPTGSHFVFVVCATKRHFISSSKEMDAERMSVAITLHTERRLCRSSIYVYQNAKLYTTHKEIMARRNFNNRRALVAPKYVPAFDIADTIRLHALGVKLPDTLLLEVVKKGGDQNLSLAVASNPQPSVREYLQQKFR